MKFVNATEGYFKTGLVARSSDVVLTKCASELISSEMLQPVW